jgi:hypothetical protein
VFLPVIFLPRPCHGALSTPTKVLRFHQSVGKAKAPIVFGGQGAASSAKVVARWALAKMGSCSTKFFR